MGHSICAGATTVVAVNVDVQKTKMSMMSLKNWRPICSRVRSKLQQSDNDPFLQAAIHAASLRFHESSRPHPILIDPYAGCFVPPFTQDMKQSLATTTSPCHYCIATKFIDDKLLGTVNHVDGPRQIVLLTDGMDTRPYRINWPRLTVIFNISAAQLLRYATAKLEGVGAKVSSTCMLHHVPLESSSLDQTLYEKGFNGNKMSIWIFQGLPLTTLESFKDILYVVSCLAAKGSLFIGEFPAWLAESEFESKMSLEKLFTCNGFKVDIIPYNEVERNMHLDSSPGYYGNILFIAEQIQFSDDQMENWRREFQRIEEDGDEDGFEEL